MQNATNTTYYAMTKADIRAYKYKSNDERHHVYKIRTTDETYKRLNDVIKVGKANKNHKDDFSKIREFDFRVMPYDNAKSKDLIMNHSVIVCKEKDAEQVESKLREVDDNITFRNNKVPKGITISVTIGDYKLPRGEWMPKDEQEEQIHYPICVLSYNRANDKDGLTHQALTKMKIAHYLFVERKEYDKYKDWYCKDYCTLIKCINFSEQQMGSTPVRNHILSFFNTKEGRAVWDWRGEGHRLKRVWMLDDNIKGWRYYHMGAKNPIYSKMIFTSIEKYIDGLSNIGAVSHNFAAMTTEGDERPVIVKNGKCFSSMLLPTTNWHVKNKGIKFEHRHQEDHFYSIAQLEAGCANLCFNHIQYDKPTSGICNGGNKTSIYKVDGSGYKDRWEYLVKTADELISAGKITLKEGCTREDFIHRDLTMKSKTHHAKLKYACLKGHDNTYCSTGKELINGPFEVDEQLLKFVVNDASEAVEPDVGGMQFAEAILDAFAKTDDEMSEITTEASGVIEIEPELEIVDDDDNTVYNTDDVIQRVEEGVSEEVVQNVILDDSYYKRMYEMLLEENAKLKKAIQILTS